MTDKLTYRDILVYTFNGLVGLILISLNFRTCLKPYIWEKEILNSEFLILVLIPICYVIGHVILSVDNLIFMQVINEERRKKMYKSKFKIINIIHCILFSHRIVGIKDKKWKRKCDSFSDACVNIKNNGKYDYANTYYVLSDTFKGLMLVEIITISISIANQDWKYFFLSIGLFTVFYLRARKYSNEYISEIIKQSRLLKK